MHGQLQDCPAGKIAARRVLSLPLPQLYTSHALALARLIQAYWIASRPMLLQLAKLPEGSNFSELNN
eukprot:3871984-Amphidinium_carterae.1